MAARCLWRSALLGGLSRRSVRIVKNDADRVAHALAQAAYAVVQAVEVAGHILQQKRRRPDLAGGMALVEKRGMRGGVARGDAHAFVPPVGDLGQPGVERAAQAADQIGQGIAEITVFALAETMP